MSIELNTVLILTGLIANLFVFIGWTNKLERRLTHVETMLGIVLRGMNVVTRSTDNLVELDTTK